jgi:hypothetical protein
MKNSNENSSSAKELFTTNVSESEPTNAQIGSVDKNQDPQLSPTSRSSSRGLDVAEEDAIAVPTLTIEEEDHHCTVALEMDDAEFAAFMRSRARIADRHVEKMEGHGRAAQACFAEDAPFIVEMRERLETSGHRTDLLTAGEKERTKEYKRRIFGAEKFSAWVELNYRCTSRWMNQKLAVWKDQKHDLKNYFERADVRSPGESTEGMESGGTPTSPCSSPEKKPRSKPDAQDIRRWKQIANAAVQNLDADTEILRSAIRTARDSMPIPLTPVETPDENETPGTNTDVSPNSCAKPLPKGTTPRALFDFLNSEYIDVLDAVFKPQSEPDEFAERLELFAGEIATAFHGDKVQVTVTVVGEKKKRKSAKSMQGDQSLSA